MLCSDWKDHLIARSYFAAFGQYFHKKTYIMKTNRQLVVIWLFRWGPLHRWSLSFGDKSLSIVLEIFPNAQFLCQMIYQSLPLLNPHHHHCSCQCHHRCRCYCHLLIAAIVLGNKSYYEKIFAAIALGKKSYDEKVLSFETISTSLLDAADHRLCHPLFMGQ